MDEFIKQYLEKNEIVVIDRPYFELGSRGLILKNPSNTIIDVQMEGNYRINFYSYPYTDEIQKIKLHFSQGYYHLEVQNPLLYEDSLQVKKIYDIKEFTLEIAIENEDYEVAAKIKELK